MVGFKRQSTIVRESLKERIDMPTSFEYVVKELGLAPEEYQNSVLLKHWVRLNMDKRYVPWDLLKVWGFVEEDKEREAAA